MPGISLSPNPAANYDTIVLDGMGRTAAELAILDDIATYIENFRAWLVTSGISARSWRPYRVQSGPWSMTSIGGSWTGTLATLPVGNKWGNAYPIVNCPNLPCVNPSWIAASGYTGFGTVNGTDPVFDSAFENATDSYFANTLELDATLQMLVDVAEKKGNSTFEPSRHAAGRVFRVNPTLWASASTAQKFSWMTRALLLAMNTGLKNFDATVVSLLHRTRPSEVTAMPSTDIAILNTAWAGVTQGTLYTFPMLPQFSPVP